MNVGIIGCGGMGHHHAYMVANCGLHIAVCGDVLKHKAEALARRYGGEATDDCLGLTARPDVDIVVVTTPTPDHVHYVVGAAQAGKHIFCEKPLGRDVLQCREALKAVRTAKVKLFVGHVVRYFQEFAAIRAQVRAGKVGKVGVVRMYRGGIFPRGEANWFWDYAKSGGVTFDCLIHDFDWLRYMFGEPKRVFCQAIMRSEPEVLDYSLVTFRMENGIIANVVGTWAHPAGFRVKVEICGDGGMLQFDSDEAPISSMMRAQAGGAPGMIIPASPVSVSPYQLEWEDFLAWIQTGRSPRATPRDALEAVRMAEAALRSAQTGKPVKL
jgi:predicted dehydrogenase